MSDFYTEHPEFDRYGECEFTTPDGYKIEISYDPDPRTPFEGYDLPNSFGIDLSNHWDWKGGEYGEACPVSVPEFLFWYDREYRNKHQGACIDAEDNWSFMQFNKNYHWLPVYLYSHSGMTIKTTPFNDRWDSGCAGLVFIKKSEAIKEGFGGIKKHWKAERRGDVVNEVLAGYVKDLDDYMRGEVYGFELTDPEGETFDSCWGFCGAEGRKECCEDALLAIESYKRNLIKVNPVKKIAHTKTMIKHHVPLAKR